MEIRKAMTAPVHTVRTTETIADAARLMAQHDVGAVPVFDDEDLAGIVTDRYIAVRGVAAGLDMNLPVVRVMTPKWRPAARPPASTTCWSGWSPTASGDSRSARPRARSWASSRSATSPGSTGTRARSGPRSAISAARAALLRRHLPRRDCRARAGPALAGPDFDPALVDDQHGDRALAQ